MSGDTLSDVLRAVRLRGAVFYYIKGSSPWVAEAPAAAEIIPGIMPGAEHLMEFHGVAEGTCWAALAGESPLRLHAGDVRALPERRRARDSERPRSAGTRAAARRLLRATPTAIAARD